jgi:ATP-binding cassette subfamily B protein
MTMSKSFPHLHQPDAMDCGATCLAMVAKHYGKSYTIQRLRDMCSATRSGVSMLGISDAAETGNSQLISYLCALLST